MTYQEHLVIKVCLCSSDIADTDGEETHRRCETVVENDFWGKCLSENVVSEE